MNETAMAVGLSGFIGLGILCAVAILAACMLSSAISRNNDDGEDQ